MTFEAAFEDVEAADRRDASRRALRLGVSGRFAQGNAAAVTVHNLSATGLLIQTDESLEAGSRFAVELPETGITEATVIWADAPMYGCRFDQPLGAAALAAAQLRGEASGTPAPDTLPEDFGQRLHRLRRERGLSLADIANRLGVSKPTVWAWEHGKSRPADRRLSALAEALGVTPGGLEPSPSGSPEILDGSRRRIAEAYGVEPSRVRIMIEL